METRCTLFPGLPAFGLLLLTPAPLAAQTTKDGISLTWDKTITVVEGEVLHQGRKLPGHTITVFETDAKTLLDLWKNDYKAIAASVGGKKPVRATGVRLTGLSQEPLLVLAETTADRKAKLGRLTLAFALNDTTPLPDEGAQREHARELAVKYNKAVVQAQIDRYQKDADKASGKLGSTQKDIAKARKNLAKANKDIEKAKAQRAKMGRANAKLHGDVNGLERKFALSNDPKDLQRLTKAREKLAKREGSIARVMKQEARAQDNANKYQKDIDASSKKEQGQAEGMGDLQRVIAELKRKQDNIR